MFLTRISVGHPVFATMIMVALMVFGIYSFQRLPVEQLPDIDLPVVAVVVSYPGASPEAVENDIVRPIEDTVSTISGIDTIQSTAQSGSAMVLMIFDMDVSSTVAAQDVRDKMASIEARMPRNANKPQVLRFDPTALPVMSLAISAEGMPASQLTTLTEKVIANRLRNVKGVGSINVVGGVPTQISVAVDPDKLDAYGVGMSEVLGAIRQNNVDLPAGAITDGSAARPIQIEGKLLEIADFADIIVTRRGGEPVRLGDVATIAAGVADDTSLAYINGERALALDVVKVQGANTVGVANDVRDLIATLLADELPKGVHIEVIRDNAAPVEESFHAVLNMLVEGALLAVVIVFLFLNSWRSTIITGLTLPIALLGTMIVLHFLGFTLNMMTLMALSLSVGILIDDAIVVRENIMRHLHMGKSHVQAALEGTKEIGLAVLATTLSIVAVFLPVAFMDGIMGRFFLQFGVTIAVAVLLSLFVAFTLDPMLSSVWYDPSAQPDARRGPVGRAIAQFERFFEWVSGGYRHVLRWCLGHRLTTLAATLMLFVSSFFLFPLVGAEFVPPADNGEFQVQIETPAGSSLAYTAVKARQVESLLAGLPEVARTYVTLNAGNRAAGENKATILATMVPAKERRVTPQQMTAPVRQLLESVPGVTSTVGAASGLGTAAKPISVTIYGDSYETLRRLSDDLVERMAGISGLADIQSSLQASQSIIGIRVDRELASEMGVTLDQVGTTLRAMLSGEDVGEWTSPAGDSYEIVVRLPADARNQPEALGDLPVARVPNGSGTTVVRLGQLAAITDSHGPDQIVRKDLARQVTVDADLSGANVGEVTQKVQAAIAAIDLPVGYRISMGGDSKQLAETMGAAGSALLLAVIFIYLVLASQFGSFLQPLAIMMSLPLSLVGVMVGLLVGGSTLNMMSMIGFIMLMGLVVKNAILLVDNANQRHRDGVNLYDALVEAGATRFRPIIMTSLAMIFGMLPLALNLHGGSGQNAPMAHAVIGGLISSTLLTLVVVPVILTYIDSFGRFAARFLPKAPVDHDLVAE